MTLSTYHLWPLLRPGSRFFLGVSGGHISNRRDKFIRLVVCCLLGGWSAVDKAVIDQLFNDLPKGNVCAKPHELPGGSLWAKLDKFGLRKRSKFYPQVLNRFPHMLVGASLIVLKLFPVGKLLNFGELKKTLVNSHAVRSHLMMFVSRILPSQGQPRRSESQTNAKPSRRAKLAGITW